MRLLCVADLQIGAGTRLGRVPHGPGSRLQDHQDAWVAACQHAAAQDCAAVIVAGDVFEHRRPSPPELLAFQAGLDVLERHRISVVVIAGNHDVRAADEPAAIEVFQTREHDTVRVHRGPTWDFLGDGVAYAVLPWAPIGALAALRGGGDRDLLHAEAGTLLADVARGLLQQIPQDATHRILIAHWAVSGAAMPTGIPTDELREVVIPALLLEEQGWDAIVLGHIHRPQFLRVPRPIVYCGSPLPCDFGEAGHEHGAWIIDLDAGAAWLNELPTRPLVTLTWPALNEPWQPGAIVRVVGHADEHDQVDEHELRRDLEAAGAHTVHVSIETARTSRARVEHATTELDPATALDLWIDAAEPDLDPATRARLNDRHRALLQEMSA